MKKYFLFLSILVALFAYGPVFSQVENIHLSWDSFKEEAAERTMAITWSTKSSAEGKVWYGEDKENLNNSVKSNRHYSEDVKANVYKATLKRLKPNTTYFYKCGSDENGWSDIFSFKTAPPKGNDEGFVVGVWGDTQNNGENRQFEKTGEIVQKMLQYPLKFTIHMGDIVENGSEIESWKNFLNTSQPLNAQFPFMPVTGNHDVCNDVDAPIFQEPFPVFHDLFNLPGNNTDYSFNYGNAHFVALSSGHAKGVEEAGKTNWRYSPKSPEYKWLEKDLRNASKDKKIAWIIIYMHHPLISYGWSQVKGWQEQVMPLINKYKVDLVLAGHRHVYERHRAMRNLEILDQENNNLYQKPNGIVYITNGTSGGSPQGTGGSEMPSMLFTSPEKMYNYSIMTIEGKDLLFEVFNKEGQKIDYFKLQK